jgi:hypothetical protein
MDMSERKNVMRTIPTLLLSALALLAAPLCTYGAHDQYHPTIHGHSVHRVSPHHHTAAPHTDHVVLVPCGHDADDQNHAIRAAGHADHDHVALVDMQSYAVTNLAGAHCLGYTYGTAPEWAREWELRWIDYDTGDGIIRIYHAMNKHDHDLRFTSSWDSARTQYHAWKPAH